MELSTFATSLAVAQEAALDRLGGWSHSICSEQYGRPFALGLQHGVYIFFGGPLNARELDQALEFSDKVTCESHQIPNRGSECNGLLTAVESAYTFS